MKSEPPHSSQLSRPYVFGKIEGEYIRGEWNDNSGLYKISKTATLMPFYGYELPDAITVKAGDKVLTAGTDYEYDKITGKVKINAAAVTDDILITATAEKAAMPLEFDINEVLPSFNEDTWYNESNSTLDTRNQYWTVSINKNEGFSNSITLDGDGSLLTKRLYIIFGYYPDVLYYYDLTYKRDTAAPAIENIGDIPEDTYPSAEIGFTVSDALSGVNSDSVKVACNDGKDVVFDGDSFTADRNGTYTITVTDNAGNQATRLVEVENIHVHRYSYTPNAENPAQIIESCTCGHSQTATLDYSTGDGRYLYTGSDITPVTVTYSAGWGGARGTEIDYSDNLNAGTSAKGSLTIGDATAAKTFEIIPYDISSATVTIDPASGKFTGSAYSPAVTVQLPGFGTLAEGRDYDVSWNEPELFNAGTYTATITGKGNFKNQIGNNTFVITNGWNPEVNNEYTVSEPNDSGWLNTDFVITAKQGYTLSLTNTADGTWSDTIAGTEEGTDSEVNFYVKNTADGTISEMATASYRLDQTSPTGRVSFDERNGWQEFLHTITFGLFYKDKVTVQAEATDSLSGVAKIEFIEASEKMSLDELQSSHAPWGEFPENGMGVTLNDAKQFIYYIRITDNAGNATCISTDGAEYDITAPVISGIDNNATYYTTQKVAVTDKNLESVILNEAEADENITLAGNMDTSYTIAATDKAGNETTVTVTMKPIASLAGPIADIAAENVKSSDKERIEQVNANLQAVDITDATDAEKAELDELIANCNALLQAISNVAAKMTELTAAVNSYTLETVKSSDKDAIDSLVGRMDALLDADNLTQSERENLASIKDSANGLLDKISDTGTEIIDISEALAGYAAETVKSSDKDAIEELLDRAEALLNGDNIAEDERENLESATDAAQTLLDRIAAVTEEYDRISEETGSYGLETVTADDKSDMENLRDDIDIILATENLTDAEISQLNGLKTKLESCLDRLEDVAELIDGLSKSIEAYEESSVKSTDQEAIEQIIKDAEMLIGTENVTADERTTLESIVQKGNLLLDKTAEAADASQSDAIQAAEDITADNVVIEDKGTLEDALKDLTDALEKFSDSYTETEKADLRNKIAAIEQALDVIDRVANVRELIDKLPDAERVTLYDKNAISSAKDAYDRLSDYEKTLVDTAKLNQAVKAIEKLQKDTNSPNTGDNTHVSLWFVLMLSAAFGVEMGISRKKNKVR